MKLCWQKNLEKWNLDSASYIIACNLFYNMHRAMIFAQTGSQATQATRLYDFFRIWPTADVLWVFIFFCKNPLFPLYSVVRVGSVSNMCDNFHFLSFSGIFCTSTCILIHIWGVNQHLRQCFPKLIKVSSILRKYLISRYALTSLHATKKENLDWPPGRSPCTIQNNMGFSSTITNHRIVIFFCPPVSVTIRNNFIILELEYLPIHHTSRFPFTLNHSQTQNHNILIRLL